MSVSYPCIRCFEQCSEPCIQCSNCNRWEHITCVPMTENELKTWDNHLLNFYCHQCCYNGVNFDSIKSLERYVANSFIHSAMKQRFWVLVKSALNRRFQRTPKNSCFKSRGCRRSMLSAKILVSLRLCCSNVVLILT